MTQPTPPGQEAPAALPSDIVVSPPPPSVTPRDPRRRRFAFTGSLREHAARGTLINTGFLVGLSTFVPDLLAPGFVILLALVAGIFHSPLWVYYRRMQFARQRLLEAIDPVVLVFGLVVGAWASAIAALVFSPFKLRLRYEPGTLRTYVSFSWPLIVASGASVIAAQTIVLVVEGHLGLAALGVMTLAATITSFTDRVDTLVTGTLYPAICAVKDQTALLYESFVKSNRLALMWAFPFGAGLTLFCSDLVTFGIGESWRPAVVVLQVYGLAAAVNHIGFNWTAYFRARGDTRPIAVAGVAAMVTFLGAGIPLTLAYDLKGFAAGVALQGLAHIVVRAYYLQRMFDGFAFIRHAGRAILPTVPAAAAVLMIRAAGPDERTLALALSELTLYVAITAVAAWHFEGRLLREAVGYLRRRPIAAEA